MTTIAFWGPRHGQVATTSNLIAVATGIAMNHQLSTLVSHTHWNRSTLEEAFKKIESSKDLQLTFSDFGIDSLERLAKSNRLNAESIRSNTSPLIQGKLDLLHGTSKPDESSHQQISNAMPLILNEADKAYDLTFVDVNSGNGNQLSNVVLKSSDLVVVCLNQNVSLLDNFFNKTEYHEVLNDKKSIIVLGNYHADSKYSAKNIARKYGVKQKIHTVPHCSPYMDAINDRNVLDFFLRNRNVNKKHETWEFFNSSAALGNAIIATLGLKGDQQEEGEE